MSEPAATSIHRAARQVVRQVVRAGAIAWCAAAGACVGSIGDGTDSETNPSNPPGTTKAPVDCSVPHAGNSPVRRLTGEEYDNTVRDLLGDTSKPSKGFIQDGSTGTFKSNAESPVTALLAVQYGDAAERLATTAVAQLDKLVSCNADASIAKDECALAFISSFGKRAYRRPLTIAERDRLDAFYKAERAAGTDFKTAIRLLVQAMLQSPNFLNHIERGVASVTPAGDTVPLTQHEMASRLSYLLWKTMPDPALMTAADNNELSSPDAMEAQARRMLKDDRGKAGVTAFYREWLELDLASHMTKKPDIFPEFNAELGKAMKDETEAFVRHVLFEGDRRFDTLLTASFSFVNEPLAKVYGVPGITGTALQKVDLDPARRSGGVLTQLSFLTGHAHTEQTSPVKRGKFVRERLLCQEMPSPPATVDVTPPKPDPLLTTRERFSEHEKNPYCAGCHRLMDPIGLGFEAYDAVGRFRTTENGLKIDTSGEIIGSDDADGKFDGPVDLAARLVKSEQVHHCVAQQWFRYAVGRYETKSESCSLQSMFDKFGSSNRDLQELVVALVRTDAFRHRKALPTPPSKEVCP